MIVTHFKTILKIDIEQLAALALFHDTVYRKRPNEIVSEINHLNLEFKIIGESLLMQIIIEFYSF